MLPDSWNIEGELATYHIHESPQFPFDWAEVSTILSNDMDVCDFVIFKKDSTGGLSVRTNANSSYTIRHAFH